MRTITLIAASAAAFLAQPAFAATIVHGTFSTGLSAVPDFDSSLGILNSATVAVQVTANRSWELRGPSGTPSSISATWSIVGGQYRVATGGELHSITIAGSGVTPVSMQGGAFSHGWLDISATGSGSYNLAAATVTDIAGGLVTLDGSDIGLYSDAGDTNISLDFPATPDQSPGRCFQTTSFPRQGQHNCAIARFTVTYDYTPRSEIPAGVPEPATWAMMLAGFGAVGHTLRRRRTGLGRMTLRSAC